jgi:hypothetical protein
VVLFGMADLMARSARTYLEAIVDPYHRLMEFTVRSGIYINFVLDIQVLRLITIGITTLTQEKFAFAFEAYSNLCDEVFFS